MRVLFDTSVAIAFRDGDARILDRAATLEPVALLSILTIVELEGGIARSQIGREQRRRALDAMYETLDILPFTRRESRVYGALVEQCGFSRSLLVDRMIAAQAIVADAAVATLNPRDFRSLPRLQVEDWSA